MKIQSKTPPRNKEDVIMKRAATVFAKVIIPYLTKGKVTVVEIVATEEIFLTTVEGRMDFVFLMSDGSYLHLEFQTTHGGIKDLVRFNLYDVMLFEQKQRPVNTYVIYSNDITKPVSSYSFGQNSYKVTPICMVEKDAETALTAVENKLKNGETLTDLDLLDVVFSPIMGGKMPKPDRIKKGVTISKECENEKSRDIQALLYLFATKFLNKIEIEQIKELIKMSDLGKMLIDEGKVAGKAEERFEIARNLLDVLDDATIVLKTGLSLDVVQNLRATT